MPRVVRWCGRGTRITLAVVILAIGLAVGRLALGPIDLTWLAPRFERALETLPGGVGARIGGLLLTWDRADTSLALRVTDVTLTDVDGDEIMALPSADVGFAVLDLLTGRLRLVSAELIGLEVVIVRAADGRWQVAAAGEPGPAAAGTIADAQAFLSSISAPPDRDDPVAGLERLRLRDGRLILRDQETDSTWTATDVRALMARGTLSGDEGLLCSVELALNNGEETARLAIDVEHTAPKAPVHVTATLTDLRPDTLAPLVADRSLMDDLAIAVSGRVLATLDAQKTEITKALAELTFGPGTIDVADLLKAPAAITGGGLTANWSLGSDGAAFRIADARLQLGTTADTGPAITATADGHWRDGRGDMSLTATVDKLDDVSRLSQWWPVTAAGNARTWVTENITAGTVSNLTIALALDTDADGDATLRNLSGQFDFGDLTVHFLRPMDAITGLTGTATIDTDRLSFRPRSGRLGDIAISEATVVISGLDAADQTLTVEHNLMGPVRSVLEALDQPPLKLLKTTTIKPNDADGTVTAQGHITFPLLEALALKDVDLGYTGAISDGSLQLTDPDITLTDAALAVEVSAEQATLKGPGKINGVPIDASWKESFGAQAAERVNLAVTVPRWDEQGRLAFGLKTAPYLTGPLSGSINIVVPGTGPTTAKLEADLKAATLAVPAVDWQKPAGEQGTARVSLVLGSEAGIVVERLDVSAGTLKAAGRGELARSGDVQRLRLSSAMLGPSRLDSLSVDRTREGYNVTARGGVVDLSPFVAGFLDSSQANEASTSSGSAGEATTVRIDATGLDRVILGPAQAWRDVSTRLVRRRGQWTDVRINADAESAPGGRRPRAPFSADIGPPSADGSLPFHVHATDAGNLIYSVIGVTPVEDGRATLTGRFKGPGLAEPIDWSVEAYDFSYRQAAVARRALAAARDRLSGDTPIDVTQFQSLKARGVLDRQTLRFDRIAGQNPSVSFLGKGSINLTSKTIAASGEVVPARSLNRALGAIPVIGDLFSTGEGFLAISVSVTGTLNDPDVDVHPLKSLTPSFIKDLGRLFGGGSDKDP